MLKHSDLIALLRLMAIPLHNNTTITLVEPSSGFKGDRVTAGFLEELLIRNASDFHGVTAITATVAQINGCKLQPVSLLTREYAAADGMMATVYGISFNDGKAVLWLTRYASAPVGVVDLNADAAIVTTGTIGGSITSTVSTPTMVRAMLEDTTDETEPTEVEDVTWFDKVAELNSDHKAWLLVQMNAAFTRIGRKDLFAELVEAISSK